MPNYCGFSMKVKGSKESILKMDKIMTADYSYGDTKANDPHFFRVWNEYMGELEPLGDDTYTRVYAGDCAWSLWTCMGREGYYEMYQNKPNFNGKSLLCCSKDLNLEIECLGEELAMEFEEYYYTNPEGKEVYECHNLDYIDEDEECSESRVVTKKCDEFRVL